MAVAETGLPGLGGKGKRMVPEWEKKSFTLN